jgi:hypothetical protein
MASGCRLGSLGGLVRRTGALGGAPTPVKTVWTASFKLGLENAGRWATARWNFVVLE